MSKSLRERLRSRPPVPVGLRACDLDPEVIAKIVEPLIHCFEEMEATKEHLIAQMESRQRIELSLAEFSNLANEAQEAIFRYCEETRVAREQLIPGHGHEADWLWTALEVLKATGLSRKKFKNLPADEALDVIRTAAKMKAAARKALADEIAKSLNTETAEKPTDNDRLPPEHLAPQSASAIAGLLGEDRTAVESFLRRYRDKYPDCYQPFEGPRKNEPKILYRMADVWPELMAWKTRRSKRRR